MTQRNQIMVKTLAISLLAIAAFSGEATSDAKDAPKLPEVTQKLLSEIEAKIQKNRAAYEASNAKVFAEYDKMLKNQMDNFSKATRIDEAMAVKKTLESYHKDVVSKVDTKAASEDATDLLGEGTVDLKKAIVGKWKRNDGVLFVYNSDHTANFYGGVGSWQYLNGEITVNWGSWGCEKLYLKDNIVSSKGTTNNNNNYTFIQIK